MLKTFKRHFSIIVTDLNRLGCYLDAIIDVHFDKNKYSKMPFDILDNIEKTFEMHILSDKVHSAFSSLNTFGKRSKFKLIDTQFRFQ